MKYSELVKLLTASGCYKVLEGKRHTIWFSPSTGKKFPVGRHKTQDVPNGTLKTILKDAGLD